MQRHDEIAVIMFEDGWLGDVSPHKPYPFMFVAEGVLPYFEEVQVRSLFLKIRDHFPGAELVCDAHTPFVVWADNLHLALAGITARLPWRLKRGREVERWGEASACPCVVTREEPSIVGGMYRVILLKKI